MKIKRFRIKNFRNISELEANPDGCHVLLMGDNSVGKSSTIEAILSCLGKKDNPLNPVQFGKDNAEVEVEGTDGTLFKVKYNKKGEPTFEVVAPNGLKDHRKSAIQQVVGGDIDFDAEEFVRWSKSADGRRKQIELVKSLLPAELIEKFNELERQIASAEKVRTETGRNRDMFDAMMKGSKIEQYDIEKFTEKVDEQDLVNKINNANEINNKRKKAIEGIDAHKNRIEEIETIIKQLQEEKQEREGKIVKIDEWLQINKEIDTKEFTDKLSSITEHNLKVAKVSEYLENSAKYDELDKEYNVLSQNIEQKRKEKKELIADSDAIPIQGLWFDEDKLFLGQVPIDSDTLSTSQIMHLGVKIMVAKNPRMKIMCIARGESLGKQRLNEIQELAEKYGYEIIMEQVIREEDELRLEFYCEGEDITKIKK